MITRPCGGSSSRLPKPFWPLCFLLLIAALACAVSLRMPRPQAVLWLRILSRTNDAAGMPVALLDS